MHWYDLPELLPPVFKKIKSMFSCAQTENTELLQFQTYINKIRYNFFVQTCDVQTLRYWESLLDIKIYEDETIEQRRNEIMLRLANNQPITILYLRKVLTDIFGDGNFEARYDRNYDYSIIIEIYDTNIKDLEKFILWFEEVCPAHIQWIASHTEKAEYDFEIDAAAQSDYSSTAIINMNGGTETLYRGSLSESVQYIEV
jgi:hypothetical protein